MSRIVLVDNNPLSFICQPTNGVLVASFYDDPSDTALASVMQLIRHLDQAGDVRPILKEMFRLDTLLNEYRSALFDDEEDSLIAEAGGLEEEEEDNAGTGEISDDDLLGEVCEPASTHAESNGGARSSPEPSISRTGATPAEAASETCLFEEGTGCRKSSSDDDDSESVETEACSEESGESSLGEPLAASEEMEMDIGF